MYLNDKTVIIGHKNPDTDSICSALAYAEFKESEGADNVLAGRAGNVNPQTDFVLKHFRKNPPELITDVSPRISDIMIQNPCVVDGNDPVLEVMRKFRDREIRFVPVMQEGSKIKGTLTVLELSEIFSSQVNPSESRRIFTTARNLTRVTDARVLVEKIDLGEKEYFVFVGAMAETSFQKTISGYAPEKLIIIVGDRERILRSAINKKVGIIIVTGGLDVPADIIDEARKQGVGLMVTPHDSASASWLVKLSASAGNYCLTQYLQFDVEEKLDSVKKAFLKSGDKGIIIVDGEGDLQGVVTKGDFLKTSNRKLILVDHNELTQSVDGADQVEIVEVVDHHRVGGIQTSRPINFTIYPVGSTCTLIAEKYRYQNVVLAKDTAGLLLSGVISDTVAGRSPTTTSRDLEIMKWLEGISGVNKDSYSLEMFGASSIMEHMTPRQILMNDFKENDIGKHRVGIGQVEVVGFTHFHRIKNDLMAELNAYRKEKGYVLAGLMITDITDEITLFCVSADTEILDNIKLTEADKNVFEMKGVLSRKKQVVPYLYDILT